MKNVGVILLGLVLISSVASADDTQGQPRSKWWASTRVKAELGLTDEQSAKIEEVFQAAVPRLRQCSSSFDRLEQQLSRTISSNEATESEVLRQADVVESARSELGKARTLMLFRMYRVLTPEQRVKLKALHDEWERDRRRPPTER